MEQYPRAITPHILNRLFQGKIIVIYGARQVGKTTLCHKIVRQFAGDALYLNCDEPTVRAALTNKSSQELKDLSAGRRLVVIDEAQRVQNIGLSLKLLVDNYPQIQLIATGSSSFDLSNDIKEPLTGRKVEFYLYPLAAAELTMREHPLETKQQLPRRLRFGSYPSVVTSDNPEEVIAEIAGSYLYRDVLEYQHVKHPDMLRRLLQALALQIGGHVSSNELAQLLQIDRATVQRYLFLLEQAFVIFRLVPFSRNLRKEIGKMPKIYFWDLGVRNAVIRNFNPLELRQDVGMLWENYFVAERMKFNRNQRNFVNSYFWRTYDGQELDLLEESGGQLRGFECKWSQKRWRVPKAFAETYPNHEAHLIHRENYLQYLTADYHNPQ